MKAPIDIMFSSVDWRCTMCGASIKVACDCLEKKKVESIERHYQELMQLSDDELIAECKRLGVKL